MLRIPGRRPDAEDVGVDQARSSAAHSAGGLAHRDTGAEGGRIRAAMCWRGDGLANPTAQFQLAGRDVAAAAFMAAVALHAKTTAVDIFVPHVALNVCSHQLHSQIAATAGDARPPAIFPESDLPGRLGSSPYHVLHGPTDFPSLSYLRSRFSDRVFPITGTAMGLSYSFDIHLYYLRLLASQFYPCDALVCPTHAAVSALEKRLLDLADRHARAWEGRPPALPQLHLIPWGVDTERFAPRDQAIARRDLGLPARRPIVLCVGRMNIHDKMDLAPLLIAFERLGHSATERPLLVLAGPPSEYAQRVLAFAAHLGLHGDVRPLFGCPSACLPSLYAASDVVVAPTDSPSETFGLTIVEAMASGRPVVGAEWDGYKELIVHGETGFKVRTDWADCLSPVNELAPFLAWEQEHLHVGQSVSVDVPQMTRCLATLVADPELRARMGQRGRERAQALYSWPVVIAQWEELWTELVAISRTVERKPWDRLDYLKPNYFQHFSHYATRIIDDEVPVKLTPRGKEALETKAPLPLDPWSAGFLHPEILYLVLGAIRPAGWIGAGLLVGDLVKLLGQKQGPGRSTVLMHLMWLAKYDYVCLGGATAEASGPLGR